MRTGPFDSSGSVVRERLPVRRRVPVAPGDRTSTVGIESYRRAGRDAGRIEPAPRRTTATRSDAVGYRFEATRRSTSIRLRIGRAPSAASPARSSRREDRREISGSQHWTGQTVQGSRRTVSSRDETTPRRDRRASDDQRKRGTDVPDCVALARGGVHEYRRSEFPCSPPRPKSRQSSTLMLRRYCIVRY